MKFELLLLLLIFSTISISARKARFHSKYGSRSRAKDFKQTRVYAFLKGFVVELAGKEHIIDACHDEFLQSIKEVGVENEPITSPAAVAAVAKKDDDVKKDTGLASVMTKVLGYLGIVIDIVCMVKTFILTALTRRFRRYRRLFFQGRTRRSFKYKTEFNTILMSKGFFSKVWDSFTDFGKTVVSNVKKVYDYSAAVTSKVVNSVVDSVENSTAFKAMKEVGSKVMEGVEYLGDKLKQAFDWVVTKVKEAWHKIVELFTSIKDKIVGWFTKHDCVKIVMASAHCLVRVSLAYIKLNVTVSKIAGIGLKLANPAGWILILTNLLCGWKLLKKAVEEFMLFVNTTGLDSSEHFGRFIANMIAALAGLTE